MNAQTVQGLRYVPGHGNVGASFRGWGETSVELTGQGRRLFGESLFRFSLAYSGGPVFYRANEWNLSDYETLASYRSEIWKHPFQKGTMIDTPAVLAARFGRGKVILFSPHPESKVESSGLLSRAIRACSRVSPEAVSITSRRP